MFVGQAKTHYSASNKSPYKTEQVQFGINLGGISDWSTQFPFLDLMKQARPWINSKETGNRYFTTDQNDWILELGEGQVATSYFFIGFPNDPVYLATAHVFFDGEGSLAFGGSKILASSTGYRLITLGTGNHAVHIKKTNPLNPIRNIRIIPDRFLVAYERGEIFNPDFLEKMDGMAGIRFMDWMKTNNSEQETWESRPKPSHRTWRDLGVPLEVMVQLANTLNATPWFNIPHLADQNYIEHFARELKSHLAPNLTVYIEHSNEVWNKQFAQAIYADTALGSDISLSLHDKFESLNLQWHSQRTAQLCDTFKNDIFANEHTRIKCVLGVQTVNFYNVERILECPAFRVEEACFKHGIDYIGITSYFDGRLTDSYSYPELNDTLVKWANEPEKYVDVAIEQLVSGDPLRGYERISKYPGAIKKFERDLVSWKAIAKKYGLGLVAYEGGQHINAQHNDLRENQKFVDFLGLVNKHPKMEDLYLQVGQLWREHGDGLHMFFTDIGRQSKWGNWGALEHVTQTESAKWNAIQKLLANPEREVNGLEQPKAQATGTQ